METIGFLHEQFEQVDDISPSVITCHSKHCKQLYRKLFTYVWDVYCIPYIIKHMKSYIPYELHIMKQIYLRYLRSPTDISNTVSLPAPANLKKRIRFCLKSLQSTDLNWTCWKAKNSKKDSSDELNQRNKKNYQRIILWIN